MLKLMFISRKIHRVFVLIISVLILIMAGTGTILKYPGITTVIPFDLGVVRYIHNNLSTVFTIALLVMMATGLALYLIPIIVRSRNKKNS